MFHAALRMCHLSARPPLRSKARGYDPTVNADTFTIRAPAREFGAAEIEGYRPSVGQSVASASELRSALWKHAILCVHLDDPLDDREAHALAEMIGPIKDPVGRTRDGGMLRYSDERQIVDAGFVLTDELRAELGDLSFGGDSFASGTVRDVPHRRHVYGAARARRPCCHARELPSAPGGATCFIDMRAAYRLLESATQARAARPARGERYNNEACSRLGSPRGTVRRARDVVHPIVRAHPITGEPALYIDLDRATHIEGLPDAEGRELLQRCRTTPRPRRRATQHAWRPTRRADLGQRLGAAQGRRRLSGRRAPAILALHDRRPCSDGILRRLTSAARARGSHSAPIEAQSVSVTAMPGSSNAARVWPELTLSSWQDTRDTFHMWTQIVGKVRMALEPMVNHWWQVTLYVSARGLTTSLMHAGSTGSRDRVRPRRPRARHAHVGRPAPSRDARAALGCQLLRGHDGRARRAGRASEDLSAAGRGRRSDPVRRRRVSTVRTTPPQCSGSGWRSSNAHRVMARFRGALHRQVEPGALLLGRCSISR